MSTLPDRRNNFDFLRLLFASLVIFSHSFPLTQTNELFSKISNQQISGGSLAVNCFFTISGYLIFRSLQRSKSPFDYLWKRILRVFPGLFVMLLCSLGIIAIVYTGKTLFAEPTFRSYLPENLSLYRVQYEVKEVFESNPYPRAINGSLWTLHLEFSLYVLLLLLFPIRNKNNWTKVMLALLIIFAIWATKKNLYLFHSVLINLRIDTALLYPLSVYFLIGSFFSLFDLQKINFWYVKSILFVIILVALLFNVYSWIVYCTVPLLVLLVGISHNSLLSIVPSKIGDISYGVYIYGFIVQQTFMNYFKIGPYTLAIVSLIVTYMLAILSWSFVEKKALLFKDLLSKRNNRKIISD